MWPAPVKASRIADIAAQLVTLFGAHFAPGFTALLATLLAPLFALIRRTVTPIVLGPHRTLHLPRVAIPRWRRRRLTLRNCGKCGCGEAEQSENADRLFHGCIVGLRPRAGQPAL
jgi:hypothetical protein